MAFVPSGRGTAVPSSNSSGSGFVPSGRGSAVTVPAPKQKNGILSSAANWFAQEGQKITGQIIDTAKNFKTPLSQGPFNATDSPTTARVPQGAAETALQLSGTVTGGLNDALGAAAAPIVTPAVQAVGNVVNTASQAAAPIISQIKDWAAQHPLASGALHGLLTGLSVASGAALPITIAKGVTVAQKELDTYEAAHPRAQKDIEAAKNLLSLLPMPGADVAIPAVEGALKTGAEVVGTAATKQAAEQASKDAVELIAPKLTRKQTAQALAGGAQVEGGKMLGQHLALSAGDEAAAEAASSVIKKGASVSENIAAVKSRIGEIATAAETRIQEIRGGVLVNKNALQGVVNGAKEAANKMLFVGDETANKVYDAIGTHFQDIFSKKPKTLIGLWHAVSELSSQGDSIVKNLFDPTAANNIKKQAITDIRRAAMTYIQSHLPEGDPFKAELDEMHNLYNAKDAIAANGALSLNKNVIERAASNLTKSTIGKIVGFSGAVEGVANFPQILHMLTSPAAIATLIGGGTIYAGTKAISSVAAKKLLESVLEGMAASSSKWTGIAGMQAAHDALKTIHDQLPD